MNIFKSLYFCCMCMGETYYTCYTTFTSPLHSYITHISRNNHKSFARPTVIILWRLEFMMALLNTVTNRFNSQFY